MKPTALTSRPDADKTRHPFLAALGERVRALRAQRGMTRKALSSAAGVSERHLANLEYGLGNASVLVLLQVSQALQCRLDALLGDSSTPTQSTRHGSQHGARLALVGLRGAGKSTLGRMLADDLGLPFVELSRDIETLAGCATPEIQALYGPEAYRRHERRALEAVVQTHSAAVIATPGGLVSDSGSFALLLARCNTVWLSARPEDHMQRVLAQGDMRPMAGNAEAMDDLRAILAARTPLYAQAGLHLDTSAAALVPTFAALRRMARHALKLPA